MEVWGQAYNAFQSCGTTRLFTCSALLFLVAVLDCCWLDREGVTFPSQKLINSLVHQLLVVTFVYAFRVKCCGSIQELGGLGTDCLEPVKLAADYSIFASCGDFGFQMWKFIKLQAFGLQTHPFVIQFGLPCAVLLPNGHVQVVNYLAF